MVLSIITTLKISSPFFEKQPATTFNINMIRCHCISRYILSSITGVFFAEAVSTSDAREQSKPWYLSDIKVGDTHLPFSPVTVLVTLVSFVMITGIFNNSPKSTATASHILLDDKDAEKRLTKYKADINNNYSKFQALAKQYSKCPSGKAAGGKLGTFKPGSMVPPFDRAIFSKENKVGEVIGPVQTNFGWHLIWIEERNLVQ